MYMGGDGARGRTGRKETPNRQEAGSGRPVRLWHGLAASEESRPGLPCLSGGATGEAGSGAEGMAVPRSFIEFRIRKGKTGKRANGKRTALLKTEILRYAQDDMNTEDCSRLSF